MKRVKLWEGSEAFKQSSNMSDFIKYVNQHKNENFQSYEDLYQWSVKNIDQFWTTLLDYSKLNTQGEYKAVKSQEIMPGVKWFEGLKLNFAQNILAYYQAHPNEHAISSFLENGAKSQITGEELIDQVKSLANYLRNHGVEKGDRVVGICSNTVEPVVAMLATTSIGAIWASCSPEFGQSTVLDRLEQIHPKVIIAVDGYQYNGKVYHKHDQLVDMINSLDSVEKVIIIHQVAMKHMYPADNWYAWSDVVTQYTEGDLEFTPLDFNDPVYILFSSGTTGKPKCIVHSVGGVLLQHYKELALHTNLKPREKFFYYTTTGWMMWNWMVSALMLGVELVIYDGSAIYPDMDRLWDFVDKEKINVFGTSAKFIDACGKEKGFMPSAGKHLRCILSTGSPLMSENFDWIYQKVKQDVQVCSISGGTDIVSCFFLGNPLRPVYRGELQCTGLGMDVKAFDEQGQAVYEKEAELVCLQPAPCMPIMFWNDPEHERYINAYFARYKNIWRHGDYIVLLKDNACIIYGRSDATLNPGGVRIGTSEIYRVVNQLDEIEDSVVVGQEYNNDVRVVLFVKFKEKQSLTSDFKQKICDVLKKQASPRHVPRLIFQVSDIPYTVSGKKVELAVRQIMHGQLIENKGAIANPEALEDFYSIKNELENSKSIVA
ncbi:MAG TPA: acetoacetate--CoA ligase [Oligoflexia bacterium]|nr:acetoacetate--CoA ligase [Oligoflexia bacterium]